MESRTTSRITLAFEGVMIGHFHDDVYEMGILPVPGHSFSIAITEEGSLGVKKSDISFSRTEVGPACARWLLEVPENAPPATLFLDGPLHPDRTKMPDLDLHLDYRWLPDVTSNEFPNHSSGGGSGLPCFKSLLKPLLIFPTGEFFARFVAPKQLHQRQGGTGPWKLFGFIPEQVAAYIDIQEGEEIALKVENTGEEVFRLQAEAGKTYTVLFRNTPPVKEESSDPDSRITDPNEIDENRPTHFQHIYLLFNVPPEKRYELRYQPTEAEPEPEFISVEAIEANLRKRKLEFGIPTSRCSPLGMTNISSFEE